MILEEFAQLGLSQPTLECLKAKGFETPSPIQRLTIPAILNTTNDIIGQAQTGTGKTAAFGLPIIEKIEAKSKKVQALILVPTRELAIQVTDELNSFSDRHLRISPIYGGAAMQEQLRRLSNGIDVVVGTPGRILDHLNRGTLDLSELKWLVLDEADEMLNMGFIDDVDMILSYADEQRRILLFSATMPGRVADLAKKYMKDVEVLKVESTQMTTELTDQIYFEVKESDKFDALTRIIDVEPDFYGIVFCRTKVAVDAVTSNLLERGYAAEGLHGDVSQMQREKILRKFKKKLVNVLIATDVAARGIDVTNLSHVINYSLPQDPESYVHRIGRTGRAGKEGTAITFISSSEYRQFVTMQKHVKTNIRKEQLPTPQDIVEVKRQKINDEMAEIISEDNYTDYLDMANNMIEMVDGDAKIALAALLRLAFKAELDETSYPEIRRIDVDRRGTARLFIALGKADGYRPKMIVDLLKTKCGIPDQKIDDVKCMEEFSFASVPFCDAEKAIQTLNQITKLQKNDMPLVSLAKEDKQKNERSADAIYDRAPRRRGGEGRGNRGGGGGRGRRSDDSRRSSSDGSRGGENHRSGGSDRRRSSGGGGDDRARRASSRRRG